MLGEGKSGFLTNRTGRLWSIVLVSNRTGVVLGTNTEENEFKAYATWARQVASGH